jgi:OFA family oxalate/formate antiporter-like MFS transporter
MDGDSKARAKSANLDMVIHRDYTRSEAVATGSFWIFNLSFAFHGFFGTALTFHIISIGSTVDFSRSEILTLFVPMAAASVSTNLFFGWINPRVRLKYLLVVMNLGCLVGICSISFLNHQLGVLAYVVGNGIAGGGFVSLSGLIWPRFFGRQHLGAISGVNMSSMVMASGLGPLVFGLSYQLTQSYQSALTFSAIALVALSILSLKADNPQRHNPSLNKN